MTAFLFPGQGSQAPGMGQDAYEESAVARDTLDEAASLLEPGFLDLLFNGPAEALTDTRNAQVALVAVGVALGRHLIGLRRRPSLCAGHSVGEITALVIAGNLEFQDAIPLTRERARLMAEETPPGTMAAVIGMAPEAIEERLPEGAEVANFNGPQQTIISGTHEGIEQASKILKDAGAKRVLPLNVSGPFHSALMAPAAEEFFAYLKDIPVKPGATPVVSSVTGHQIREYTSIPQLLAEQLCAPVRWTDVMRLIGPVPALEVGPGNVLQGLARRMNSAPIVHSAGTLGAIESLGI